MAILNAVDITGFSNIENASPVAVLLDIIISNADDIGGFDIEDASIVLTTGTISMFDAEEIAQPSQIENAGHFIYEGQDKLILDSSEVFIGSLPIYPDDTAVALNFTLTLPPLPVYNPCTYYVDASLSSGGNGTIGYPWTVSQMRDYLKGDGVHDFVDGDVIRVKGAISVTEDKFFNINTVYTGATIIMEGWDIENNGPFIIKCDVEVTTVDTVRWWDQIANVERFYPTLALFYQNVSQAINFSLRDVVILTDYSSNNHIDIVRVHTEPAASVDSDFNIVNTLITGDSNISGISTRTPFGYRGSSITFVGSTISCDGYFKTIRGDETAVNYNTMKNCVVNIDGYMDTESGSWNFDASNTETNKDTYEFSIAGEYYMMVYNSNALYGMPKTSQVDRFYVDWYQNHLYDITAVYDPDPVYLGYQGTYTVGLKGLTRTGVGAFWFYIPKQLYVDGDSNTPGVGTIGEKFTYDQFRNYFNPAVGYACNIDATSGDEFYISGICNIINSQSFLDIAVTVPGAIKISADGITSNGLWHIETVNAPSSDINLVSNSDSEYFIGNLTIKDFSFLRNNGSSNDLKVIDASYDYGASLNLKNFLMYCVEGTIDHIIPENIECNCYGGTYNCDDISMSGSSGYLTFYDTIINSNSVS